MNKETLQDVVCKNMIKDIYNFADHEIKADDILSIKEAIYDSTDKISRELGIINITEINKDEIKFNLKEELFFNINNNGVICQNTHFGDLYVGILKPEYVYAMNTGLNYIFQKEALEKMTEFENSLKNEKSIGENSKDKNYEELDASIII